MLRETANRRGLVLTSDQEGEIIRRANGKDVAEGLTELWHGLLAVQAIDRQPHGRA